MKLTKKLLAIMLSLIMVFSMIAVPVSAAETTTETPVVEEIVGEETTDEEAAEEESVGEFHEIFEAIKNLIEAIHNLVGGIMGNLGKECPFCGEVHEKDVEEPETPEVPEDPSEPDIQTYVLEVIPSFGGSVIDVSGNYVEGHVIDIKATPDEGWKFIGWEVSNGGIIEDVLASETKFTMSASSSTIVAKFSKIGQAALTEDEEAVYRAYYGTEIIYSDGDYSGSVTKNITLPLSYGVGDQEVVIVWSSSEDDCIDNEGVVTRSNESKTVVLTATFIKGEAVYKKDYTVTVIKLSNIKKEEINDNLITDLEELNKNSQYELEVEYNEDESKVEFISGSYSDIAVDSVESALLSLYSVKSMIGINDPENELMWNATNHNDDTISYSFIQIYEGVEVFGRTITVSADKTTGKTLSLSSNALKKSELDTVDCNADISEEVAVAIFESSETIINCTKAIYAIDSYQNSPILVYVIETADEIIIVNADNGELILRYDTVISFGDYSTTGKGKTEQGNIITFPVQFHQWDMWFYYQEDVSRNIELFGGNHSITTKEFNTEWGDKTANSAYTNIIKAYDYYYNTFGRRSVDNAGKKIEVNVHNELCKGSDNAHSHGSSGVFCFFDNGNGSLPTTAAGYDIAVHEYTHNVFGNIINTEFPYANYTGAINEGYADIFACFADGDWVVGEDWKTLRNLSNPEGSGYPSKLSSSNYTENGEVHKNSTIVSHVAYLMSSYGISKSKLQKIWYDSMDGGYNATSTFKSVRRYVIQAAKDNNFSDDELAKVRKAFDTVEIYDERCYQLKVNIADSENNKINLGTHRAKISLQRNKHDVPGVSHSATSSINPVEFKNIYFGEYQMKVEIEGYEPFVGSIYLNKNTTMTTTVKLVKAGIAKVSGVVTSATTARPVEGATYKLVEGFNMTSGIIIKQGTANINGYYSFEIPSGYYTMIVSKDGYVTGYFNVTAEGGKSITNNVSISPSLIGNNFRVVLRWGSSPSDLDSHLFGYPANGSSYHIYYRNKTAHSNGTKIADLDVDDTSSYGPETTTFVVDASGKYEYYIDWYTGSGTWATCGGNIEVYNGDRLIYEFTVPNVGNQSGSWKVFTIENGIFKAHNIISGDIY